MTGPVTGPVTGAVQDQSPIDHLKLYLIESRRSRQLLYLTFFVSLPVGSPGRKVHRRISGS